MQAQKLRICVIGAGPAAMSVNVAFKMAQDAGQAIPELVFFEKQDTVGGLWNYTWRTGVDNNGEPIHATMYQGLHVNAPKETFEFPYYTYMDHWGRNTNSYPSREAQRDYIVGRFMRFGEPAWIQFNTVVKAVTFDDMSQKFTVTTRNYSEPEQKVHVFDYVICCTGHFSFPTAPEIPGLETYSGTVIHSHDQRSFKPYKGKTVMVIGTSYSGEDIASISYKNGAKRIICSYRGKPMPYNWPSCFENHPMPAKVDGSTVYFKDGAKIDVDVIIFCTGFLLHYPFLEQKLQLQSPNQIVPLMLYKSLFMMQNNKMIYIGSQQQPHNLLLFDVQSFYLRDVLMGKIKLPPAKEQKAWLDKWLAAQASLKNGFEKIRLQGHYMTELMAESDYPKKWDIRKTNALFDQWLEAKQRNILTFRDKTYTSIHTGVRSLKPKIPWLQHHSYSLESFFKNCIMPDQRPLQPSDDSSAEVYQQQVSQLRAKL